MKNIFLLMILPLVLFSCNTEEQPVGIQIDNKTFDVPFSANYKEDLANRPIVVGMHYGWGTQPSYSLVNTPNYLDFIILKDNYYNPSPLMMLDLKEVQNIKFTNVLFSVDFQEITEKFNRQINADYKTAKKETQKRWLKDNTKPATQAAELDSLNALKDTIKNRTIREVQDLLKQQFKVIPDYFTILGYDGISLRLSNTDDILSKSFVDTLVSPILKIAGQDKPLFLFIESPQERYNDIVSKANYIIGYMPDKPSFEALQRQSNTYSNTKYLPAFNVLDPNFSKGYGDYPYFSATTLNQAEALLHFKSNNYGGIAVYHSEAYYYDGIGEDKGYKKPYASFISYINQVLNKKN